MNSKLYLGGVQFSIIENGLLIQDIKNLITTKTELKEDEFNLFHNGKLVKNNEEVVISDVHAIFRVLGGKGGFGSMLRAIGAQIEKTTNREACRDLSGRRLRDINEEKRLKAWLEKQKDRETEADERRKRKIQKLITVPKHEFKDVAYENARSILTEKVSDAVEEGFKKATLKPGNPVAIKRKAMDNGKQTVKKAALWIGDELSSSSETDTDDESVGENANSSKERAIAGSSGGDSGAECSNSENTSNNKSDTEGTPDDAEKDKIDPEADSRDESASTDVELLNKL